MGGGDDPRGVARNAMVPPVGLGRRCQHANIMLRGACADAARGCGDENHSQTRLDDPAAPPLPRLARGCRRMDAALCTALCACRTGLRVSAAYRRSLHLVLLGVCMESSTPCESAIGSCELSDVRADTRSCPTVYIKKYRFSQNQPFGCKIHD